METRAFLLGSALLLGNSLISSDADAKSTHRHGPGGPAQPSGTAFPGTGIQATDVQGPRGSAYGTSADWTYARWNSPYRLSHVARNRHAVPQAYSISCVPYARQVSGIEVAGNAWQWWDNAFGEYARGARPEPGSVLAFRANARMQLGHVAVVRHVVNAREIVVDHANWPSRGMRGGVSHGVTILDVSEANNWSAVRVQLSNSADFGSIYPTYGFIYNRPDNGVMTASIARPAPQPAVNPVPSDLRPAAERPWHMTEEVAEFPASRSRGVDLRFNQQPLDR